MKFSFQHRAGMSEKASQLWDGGEIPVKEWESRGRPEMWHMVETIPVQHGGYDETYRLDVDQAYGKLRIVNGDNTIVAIGSDVVFVETDKFIVVALGMYFGFDKPYLFLKLK